MKILDLEQGSAAWFSARAGIPTASEFHRLMTPGGKAAKGEKTRAYMIRLLTERLLGRSMETETEMEWMQRGRELEPQAAAAYAFEYDCDLKLVGFATSDDGRIGASPDRLIVDGNGEIIGGLEIKCPAPHTHVGYMLDGFGTDYMPQVQGQLFVTGLPYIDRYSFHPEMPPVRLRTFRDEPYIFALSLALSVFCDELDSLYARISQEGIFAIRRTILTPIEQAYLEPAAEERNPFEGG